MAPNRLTIGGHTLYLVVMERTLADIESSDPDRRQLPKRQNGAAIRALREKDGWSQTALAREVGIRQATLSGIESESANAQVTTLNRIARALRVPVAAVMRDCMTAEAGSAAA
jgi:DNA-binding XRE family transcriptional regulator